MRLGSGLAVLLLAATVACEDSVEYVVLIEVESAIDLERIDVVAAPEGGWPAVQSETGLVATSAELAIAPARVVVQLVAPGPVKVRILGRAADGTVATAVRCYEVSAVPTEDRVLLVAGLADDIDLDGWPSNPMSACVAPGPMPCAQFACPASAADCDDASPDVSPGGADLCGIDRSCDGAPGPCIDEDMDGVSECPAGVDDPSCDCNDADALILPGADDVCGDGIDQNCDGSDGRCDRDMDGADADVDCDDADPLRYPGADEVCTPSGETPRDENCNGIVDELAECGPDDRDGDGYISCDRMPAPMPCDCDDCDSGRAPGRTEVCGDGIDQDCSGADLTCAAGDADGDGSVSMTMGGTDCDDTNPLVRPGAIENCMTPVSESCGTAATDCGADVDGDGWLEPADCERAGVAIAPDQMELCDGLDNDCDGVVDEVDAMGFGCVLDVARTMAVALEYDADLLNCGGCGVRCDVMIEADLCMDGACRCSTSDNGDPGPACADGENCCDVGRRTGCFDLSSSFDACGACDAGCDESFASACVGGRCMCGADAECVAPYECCDTGGVDACRNLTNDERNCGRCGAQCGAREVCVEGRCTCVDDVGDEGDGAVCTGDDVCCRMGCKKHSC